MPSEFNWPKKGMKLFVPTDEDVAYFHMPSVLAFDPVHARGFKEAAELVLNKCEGEGDTPSNDMLVFPVVYLYRHGIELNLKDIIRLGVRLDFVKNEDVEDDLKWHNLARLWTHAKKTLLRRYEGHDPTPLYATESLINQLHESDPNGQVFRYQSDKDGKLHKYEKLPDKICVVELRKSMDAVFSFLEATCGGLEEALQMKVDWEAEMRAEMEAEFRSQYRYDG